MNDKKNEHDALEKRHHFSLWEEDLENFLVALDKYEAQEEKDRLALGGLKNEDKAKRRKPAAAKQKEAASTASETVKAPKPKLVKEKPKVDPMDLPLRERLELAAKTNTGLAPEPKKVLEGKRSLKDANIYDELMQLQAGDGLKRKKEAENKAISKSKPVQRKRIVADSDSESSSDFSVNDDSDY